MGVWAAEEWVCGPPHCSVAFCLLRSRLGAWPPFFGRSAAPLVVAQVSVDLAAALVRQTKNVRLDLLKRNRSFREVSLSRVSGWTDRRMNGCVEIEQAEGRSWRNRRWCGTSRKEAPCTCLRLVQSVLESVQNPRQTCGRIGAQEGSLSSRFAGFGRSGEG